MATLDAEFHVNDLPIEIFEHVFSYLPLGDRKAVSLVCQLWNELVFSRRFLSNVALNLIMDWEQSQVSVLQQSNRLYRNIFAFFGPETCCEFDFSLIIEVLDLFGAVVESFHCMTNFTVEQLWNIVTRAPNLQQLIVGVDAASLKLNQRDFPVLQHLNDLGSLINVLRIEKLAVPKLRLLSANFIKPEDAEESIMVLRKLAPRLKSLELFSTEYFIPIDDLQLPEVEVLKLSGRICDTSDYVLKRFFFGCRRLKEVRLDFNVREPVLDIITQACSGIEKFHLKAYLLESDSFRLLERLKHLKILSLSGSIDFRTTSECKPLVSVQQLNLQMGHLNDEAGTIESLHRLLPNVVAMNVTFMTLSRPEGILVHVCRNFSHLKRLAISDENAQYRMLSSRILQALRHLDQLEELTLKCIHTRVAFMLSNKRLKRLKIKYFHSLIDADLLMLSRMYPNLKYLELAWCRKITPTGIAMFRSQLMDCVVCHSKL